jgi:hypothetical protein
MRNLDGEAKQLISNNSQPTERKFNFNADKIGSIQKTFQNRNAFESSKTNPLSRLYETAPHVS